MTKVTIEAFDKDGNKLGERTEDKPDTLAEMQGEFENKDIVTLAWRSHVIDVQRELRAEATAKTTATPLVKALRKATPEQQAAIAAKMKELGL